MQNTYLAHHGIKGMKWGVRRTPAQLGHPESEAKKAYKSDIQKAKARRDKAIWNAPGDMEGEYRAQKQATSQYKKDKKAAKARYKEARAAEREVQRRETALTTHSAKKLAKNMDTLSDKELKQRYNRLNMEQNVRNLSRQSTSVGRNIVRDAAHEVAKDQVKSYARKGAVALAAVAGPAIVGYAATTAPGQKAIGAGVNALVKMPGKW